jgi:hypothetical protein
VKHPTRFDTKIRLLKLFRTRPRGGVLHDVDVERRVAVAGDCILGSALRSNAALKFAAVTAWPVENFVKLALTVKS